MNYVNQNWSSPSPPEKTLILNNCIAMKVVIEQMYFSRKSEYRSEQKKNLNEKLTLSYDAKDNSFSLIHS